MELGFKDHAMKELNVPGVMTKQAAATILRTAHEYGRIGRVSPTTDPAWSMMR